MSPLELRTAVENARSLGAGVVDDFEISRVDVIAQLEHDPRLQAAVVEHFSRGVDTSAQQSHDFLQLAKLVGSYAEVLLRSIEPEQEPSRTAEQHEVEGSIYFATEMMVQKLDALAYLQDPYLARSRGKTFEIHRLFLKYLRLYQWKARQKGMSLKVSGECFESVYYDDHAIGALLQALLDNMVKYAPSGSHAEINFDVVGGSIRLTFNSLGPRIDPREYKSIFTLGVRGEAARRVEEVGQGVGLATAHQISEVLDLNLAVDQTTNESTRYPGHFGTSFTFEMRSTR